MTREKTGDRDRRRLPLHGQIAIAMALALGLGGLARATGIEAHPAIVAPIQFVGELFLRLLKMIVVPLVLTSIVVGIASLNVRAVGRIGGRTLGFYLLSTSLAVLTGLLAIRITRPGRGADLAAANAPTIEPEPLLDILLRIVPENPFASMVETFDLLSVIFVGVLVGLAISAVGPKARPLHDLMEALHAVTFRITDWVIRLTPYGVFALIALVVLDTGIGVLLSLVGYFLTVAFALAVHGLLGLPLLLHLLGRVPPRPFARAMAPALLTAFSTASSAATLPVTMESIEKRAGVERRVHSFVLPIGATVNMDGTALYQAIAAVFVAQAFGIDLTLGQQVVVFLTATLAAIGAAGVPGAGLVTMVIVFQAVGIPLEGIGLIVAVDRLLDMMRTSVNVWGDACAAAVVGRAEGAMDLSVLMDGGSSPNGPATP